MNASVTGESRVPSGLDLLAEAAAFVEGTRDLGGIIKNSSNRLHNTEPPSRSLKREREPDEFFCEEKLIIDEDELSEVNEHQAINGKSQKPLHSPLFTSSELVAGPEVSPTIANSPSQESTNPTNLVSSADIHRYNEHQQHEGVITSSHFIDSQHNSNSNHSLSSGSGNADNGPSEEKKSRSSNGVAGGFRTGTREVHNKLEKNRRAHLKECFDRLKATIPGMTNRKTSNLNVLKEAVTYTKHLRKQNIDYDRKMTETTRINIELQNKCKALKMKMSLQPEWQNVDLDKVFPIQDIDINVTHIESESIDADPSDGLSKSEARYSSTSSLSSAATASSPQTIQTSNTVKLISSNNRNSQSSPISSITSASTNVTASSQTHIIKQVSSNNSRPRIVRSSCSPTFRPIVPSTMADKITITTSNAMTVMRPQTPQQFSPLQQQQQQHQLISQQQPVSVTQQQLHLPINTQVISTSPSLATFMPTHFGQQLRVIPADARPLIVQSNGTIATSSANGEQKSLLLVASNTSSNENRVTLLQSTLTYANNEGRPLLLTTHAPAISVTTAQTRIRTIEATQATSKRIGGVALVGGAGPELARLPGGAELNILPANGIFRSVKAPVTGVTLSHAGVSLQPTKPTTATHTTTLVQQTTSSNNGSIAPPSSGQQAAQQHHEGIQANCHLVTTQSGHQQLASLTPVIGPTMTVLSQGSNSQVILTPAGPLTGKVIGTPIIKAGQLMSAQYLTGVGKLGNPNVVIVNPNHQQHPAPASVQQSNNGPTSNGDSNVIASTRSPA